MRNIGFIRKLICFAIVTPLFLQACEKKKEEKSESATSSAQTLQNKTNPDPLADAEKEKALKNPYPNDLGPDLIDISKYGDDLQEGYHLIIDKCAKCHSSSRPLNSQFLELTEQEIAQAKKERPEIFRDKLTWQTEPGIWQRYVKRMMAKPGCNISSEEGKKIWKFLVEDSKRRKTGADAKTWTAHRKNLIAQFKAKHPERYQELFPSAK